MNSRRIVVPGVTATSDTTVESPVEGVSPVHASPVIPAIGDVSSESPDEVSGVIEIQRRRAAQILYNEFKRQSVMLRPRSNSVIVLDGSIS